MDKPASLGMIRCLGAVVVVVGSVPLQSLRNAPLYSNGHDDTTASAVCPTTLG